MILKNHKNNFKKIAIAVIVLVILITILISNIIQELLANGLLAALAFILFFASLPFIVFVTCLYFLYKLKGISKILIFLFGYIISVSLIIVSFKYINLFRYFRFSHFYGVLLISIIICRLVLSKDGQIVKLYISYLIILLVMATPAFLRYSLPFLYSPPVLTVESSGIYNKCINFLEAHNDHKSFRLSRIGPIWIDGHSIGSKDNNYFTEDELYEIRKLRNRLYKKGCFRLQREDDFVMFYRNSNLILPSGAGALFSLNSRNPNMVDNEILNELKPFVPISGNWYMSRNLTIGGPRSDKLYKVPEPLIDHSLQVDGLNLNK